MVVILDMVSVVWRMGTLDGKPRNPWPRACELKKLDVCVL